MAKQINIVVTDHANQCAGYYLVEWKLTGALAYNSTKKYTDTFSIPNLEDAETYDVRVTRVCCDGVSSTPETDIVDTTSDSPQLDAPLTFVAVAGGSTGEIDVSWLSVTDAENYECQLSLTDDFNVIAHTLITIDPTVSGTISGLTPSATYWGRVRAKAIVFLTSDWSNEDSAIATP